MTRDLAGDGGDLKPGQLLRTDHQRLDGPRRDPDPFEQGGRKARDPALSGEGREFPRQPCHLFSERSGTPGAEELAQRERKAVLDLVQRVCGNPLGPQGGR